MDNGLGTVPKGGCGQLEGDRVGPDRPHRRVSTLGREPSGARPSPKEGVDNGKGTVGDRRVLLKLGFQRSTESESITTTCYN